jgi:hypothetical protein
VETALRGAPGARLQFLDFFFSTECNDRCSRRQRADSVEDSRREEWVCISSDGAGVAGVPEWPVVRAARNRMAGAVTFLHATDNPRRISQCNQQSKLLTCALAVS